LVAVATRELAPSSFEQAASMLAAAAGEGQTVRIRGAGTKLAWGAATAEPDLELCSSGLDQLLEHNVGDLTAVLQAGAPVARAQETFAAEGQMLALDPALGIGRDRDATIGGLLATGDCGPLRHRYGAPRDLVLGMTVALSDGTIAKSGSKVIKNVAGYDIAKLFCGSFGTLGMILSVSVRLHPLPVNAITALGASGDHRVLSAAAVALSRAPLELESLDVAWKAGRGGMLARVAGVQADSRAEQIAAIMRKAGLEQVDTTSDDDSLWARQRAGQRAQNGNALVRVAARPSALGLVLNASDTAGGTLVGRATLGTSYVELDPDAVASFREALPPKAVSVLLDGPRSLREQLDPWGESSPGALELMRRIKLRFDPAQVCNPGVFVGAI
jgi:glycolate oxidase FAD binding subunit